MKKIVLSMLAFAAVCGNVLAQNFTEEQKEKMEKEDVVPSKIITNKGDTVVGFLQRMKVPTVYDLGYNDDPNVVTVCVVPSTEFARKIRFITEQDFNSERIKNNMYEKYTPKDIKGYIYDYTGENLIFRTLNVKCKNFTYNGQTFVKYVQDLANGEVYYDYYFPFNVQIGTPTLDELEPFTHAHHAVYLPDTKKVILVEDQKPEEFYAKRCPQIVENWKNNKYTDVSSKKDSKLNKLSKLASKIDQTTKNKVRDTAFEDYVNTCINNK